jgi:hypothetical protein
MKALMGQSITCPKCGEVVGEFRKDVVDNSVIVEEAVTIYTNTRPEISSLSWHCAGCDVPIAFGGYSWRVHTAGGWLS